jgi:ElaB/YqjD/DUF883 family membrane-anchored ribosome-binding protein
VEEYLQELTDSGASFASKAADTVREYAHGAQKTVQDAAKSATDTVKAGYAFAEETVQKRPVESLAVCFGAGLITGVVVGLMLRSR